MRRTDIQDTALWTHRTIILRLREMTVEEKFRKLFDRIESGRQIHALAQERKTTR